MGTISPQVISLTGLAPTFAAVAAGGDEVTNDGNVYVEIVNSHASNSYTVTATTPADVDGVAIENPTLTVPAQSRRKWGPFKPSTFNNANGRVALSYAGTAPATDLTIGAFKGV